MQRIVTATLRVPLHPQIAGATRIIHGFNRAIWGQGQHPQATSIADCLVVVRDNLWKRIKIGRQPAIRAHDAHWMTLIVQVQLRC